MKLTKGTAEAFLVTVKESPGQIPYHPHVILPEELLSHNFNNMEKHYFIHDIQQYASEFSKKDDVYILGHEVTADFPEHNHDFYELTYVCKGDLVNVVDGNELYMHQSDISLINSTAVQSLRCINPDTLIVNFCIKEKLLERILNGFGADQNLISDFLRNGNPNSQNYMYFSEGFNADISLFINRGIQEYTEAGFHQTYPLEAWLILLFHALSRSSHYSYLGIDEKALEILHYLQKNCLHSSLRTMAAALGYNANYLTGYIKKHTGRNYREIEKEARLTEAARLLAETDQPVYDVAESCGYGSPSHFFKVFREKYGVTPQKYRKQF